MKLKAEIKGEIVEVDLQSDGERVFGTIGGRSFDSLFSSPEKGVFLFNKDGAVHEAVVSQVADQTSVRVGGHDVMLTLTNPKTLRGSSLASSEANAAAEIKTAMPGKVVRILKAEGEEVTKGEGVIVVEAMKMQNELKSQTDGIIKAIKVAENDTVAAGEVLVVIEASA